MKNNLIKLALPAAVMLAGVSAYAVPTLTLSDNNGNTTGAIALVGGTATFAGAVGDWTVNVTTALTYPILGSTSEPHMDVNSIDLYTGLGGLGSTLTITFNADGFGPSVTGTLLGEIGGTLTPNMTVTFNTLANGNPLTTSGAITTSPYADGQLGALNNFSGTLTEQIILTATGPGQLASFDAGFSTVPDSGTTLLLLGSSLTVLGVFARSRKVTA